MRLRIFAWQNTSIKQRVVKRSMDEKEQQNKPKHRLSFILNEQEKTSSQSANSLNPSMQYPPSTENTSSLIYQQQQLTNPYQSSPNRMHEPSSSGMRIASTQQRSFQPIRGRDNSQTSHEHFFHPYQVRQQHQPSQMPHMRPNLLDFSIQGPPVTQQNFSRQHSNMLLGLNQNVSMPAPMYSTTTQQHQPNIPFPSRALPYSQMPYSSSPSTQIGSSSRKSPPSSFVPYNSNTILPNLQQQQVPLNREMPTNLPKPQMSPFPLYLQSGSSSIPGPSVASKTQQMLPSMSDLFAKKEDAAGGTILSDQRPVVTARTKSESPQEEEAEEEDSNDEDYTTMLESTEISTINNKLLPIRILAYKLGLNKDPHKPWRYRDFKRALFEKLSKAHETFIESSPYHQLLKERLPHKLSMSSFCKRIMLLIFHFIIRDGKEPKFWTRKEVKQSLIENVLECYEADFYRHVNRNIAFRTRALLQIHYSTSTHVDNYSLHTTEALSTSVANATRQFEMQRIQGTDPQPQQQQASSSSSNELRR